MVHIGGMRKTPDTQLSLLELPRSTSTGTSTGPARRAPRVAAQLPARMAPALIAMHSGALLAEIDRIARARRALSERARGDDARAMHLAALFTAAERAQAADPDEKRSGASREQAELASGRRSSVA